MSLRLSDPVEVRNTEELDDPCTSMTMTDSRRAPDPHTNNASNRRARHTLLVAIGGTVGVWARYALTISPLGVNNEEWVILVVNIVGCFMLGWLVTSIDRRVMSAPRRLDLRALLATGALGGFTTYSTMAVHVAALGRDGSLTTAVLYAVATVTLGIGAVVLGKQLGSVGQVERVKTS